MYKKIIIFLLSALFLLMPYQKIFAQVHPDLLNSEESFEIIKSQIVLLLEENVRLENQYNALTQEYYDINKKIEGHNRNIKDLARQSFAAVESNEKKKQDLKNLKKKYERIENEAVIKKSKKTFMEAKYIDMAETTRLLELRAKEFDYEKRELELELKFKEEELKNKTEAINNNLKDIKNRFEDLNKQKQELLVRISELEKKEIQNPDIIQKLKIEIEELEIKNKKLNSDLDIKRSERGLLEDKKTLVSASFQEVMKLKEQQKEELISYVDSLNKTYEAMDKDVKESLLQQHHDKKVLNEIVGLDKENLELREKILQLEAQLKK